MYQKLRSTKKNADCDHGIIYVYFVLSVVKNIATEAEKYVNCMSTMNPLEKTAILDNLTANVRQQCRAIHVFDEIDSTNQWMLLQIDNKMPLPAVCVANRQTAGRGRRGRDWVSPPNNNIYMSLGWRFSVDYRTIQSLSLAVGVALARVIEHLGVSHVGLKWPNDVLIDGKKVAGILIESSGIRARDSQFVVGIGLNVDMSDEPYTQIDQPWTDLKQAGVDLSAFDRNYLAALLIRSCVAVFERYEQDGYAELPDDWSRWDVCLGKKVVVAEETGELIGLACGINQDGALQLDVDHQRRLIYSGDVSLRIEQPG